MPCLFRRTKFYNLSTCQGHGGRVVDSVFAFYSENFTEHFQYQRSNCTGLKDKNTRKKAGFAPHYIHGLVQSTISSRLDLSKANVIQLLHWTFDWTDWNR